MDPVVSLKSDWNEVLAAESTGEALGIWASKTATNVKNMPGAVATGVTEGVRNLGEWGGHAATAQYYAATGDQEKALAFAEKAGESAGKVGTEAAIDAVGGKVLHTVATKGLPKIPTLPDAPQVPGSLAPAGGPGRIPDTQAPNANLASMGDKDKLAEMYPSEPPPGSAAAASKEGATTTFPTKEQAIADYLEETTGLKATPNPLEGVRGAGRQGDAFIAGIKHEFKTLDVGATNKTISNAVSRSLARGGQARNFVFDARGSGLSLDEARRGVYRASGGFPDQIDHITVIGDDYFWVGGPRR